MGGDYGYVFENPVLFSFNPRPRMGGDPRIYLLLVLVISFNTVEHSNLALDVCPCFNPRPRMGGELRFRL